MTAHREPAANRLQVVLDCGSEGAVVRLKGAATLDEADSLRDHLLALAGSLQGRLVLDLGGLEFINSVGLGALVTAHVRCHRLGGWMRIANPSPEIRHLLTLTSLTRLFEVYDSVADALHAPGPAGTR